MAEQSGIKAGDGGFDVKVGKDAALIGGAITSTQEAVDKGRNRFEAKGRTRQRQAQQNQAQAMQHKPRGTLNAPQR